MVEYFSGSRRRHRDCQIAERHSPALSDYFGAMSFNAFSSLFSQQDWLEISDTTHCVRHAEKALMMIIPNLEYLNKRPNVLIVLRRLGRWPMPPKGGRDRQMAQRASVMSPPPK